MIVRITRTDQAGTTVLLVEGGLSSAFVDEMARECASLDGAFVLELSNLRRVDAAGASLLAELASKGVEMRGVSPYIAMRMQQYDSSTRSSNASVA